MSLTICFKNKSSQFPILINTILGMKMILLASHFTLQTAQNPSVHLPNRTGGSCAETAAHQNL